MYIPWHHSAFRYTGRWSNLDKRTDFEEEIPLMTQTTTPGAYLELAFTGNMALLEFDLGFAIQPVPHLWISLDGGHCFEVPLDRYLRIKASDPGEHILKVLYKGGVEVWHRWYAPLLGVISFRGVTVESPAILPPDKRKIIEFVGDSITEGVLVDEDYGSQPGGLSGQLSRTYQDDNSATYAALVAEQLNLRAMFQAYGAVGVTHGGCGSVPRAGLIYPWVFDGVLYGGEKPDYVVLNHGVNDRRAEPTEFSMRYTELLEVIHACSPDAILVCLTPFFGCFQQEIACCVEKYNSLHTRPAYFISSDGWISQEPMHPLRTGHQIIANHLTAILKNIIKIER